MATSDALILGEDFLSEHYFTTDARSQSFQAKVIERRKGWDAEREQGHPTPRSRYTEARGDLGRAFIGLAENAEVDVLDPLYGRLRKILGFDNAVRWETHRIGGRDDEPGPAIAVRTRGLAGPAPLVIIEARGALALEDLLAKDEKTLLRTFHTDDEEIVSAARLLSHLFVADDGPQFALVLAGELALITERERWLEGRYLAVNLQLIGERNDDKRGGEIDHALSCLAADSLAPDAEGNLWWSTVIDESIKHTVGVSEDLREGVRLSIEIIANEVVTRRAEQNLAALPPEQAQPLARQSLRFLYRILFLLYAEAAPELGVLPVGDPAYERGYSLDRLRELTLTELVTPRGRSGTHLYESLHVLFGLVDRGHDGSGDDPAAAEGLTFRSLRADLFKPEATALIDETKLGNAALQQVFRHLLLSKEVRSRDRGFISYAQLGINQLGAVYEGLMSYTGFFATEDLYEVAKNGDASKGSWVVPATRIEGISETDFVRTLDEDTKENKPVVHRRGTFVYRLAGRERQQSASYYSPEVLTRFVVGQALAELLDQDGQRTSARDILELTVCEPALGSGAFAVEAVRQLAEEYLSRRQDELGERIDPDRYPTELQRVKAYIALHQVYGVDLNATAVEFAEISLWLATMGEGLSAPWFGLHLRRGNSLVGARRAVITAASLREKGWLQATPVDKPLSTLGDDLAGGVHHFLLPTDGWGSTADAKEAKELAPEALERVQDWRKALRPKLNKTQIGTLAALARRTDRVWQLALRRLHIAESQIRRPIDVWGADDLPVGGKVSREQIEESLADGRGAYRRLRRVMDAWCALWFWPLTDEIATVDGQLARPPSVEQWIDALQQLLGIELKVRARDADQHSLTDIDDWHDLDVAEANDLAFAQAKDPAEVLAAHPWLVVCERLSDRYGFFHWELDLAPVFALGGFDLQVGNPPWVRPDFDESAALAEFDVAWALETKIATSRYKPLKAQTLARPAARPFYVDELALAVGMRAFASDAGNYPSLVGLRPDLYRCFMECTWRNMSSLGIVSLIHPETHFTDEKAGHLRKTTYRRLRRHWQFINELQLFEISNHVSYGVHVYGIPRLPAFLQAASLYHPDTVVRSFDHDGSGPAPGLKDSDGQWDFRPHANRLTSVNSQVLSVWKDILEPPDVPIEHTRMVYSVNQSVAHVLNKLCNAERLKILDLRYSMGWNETEDFARGLFTKQWGVPDSWHEVILQGPHMHVATPLYKTPNSTMQSNRDWSTTDFEGLNPHALPATTYRPAADSARYDAAYTKWELDGDLVSARNFYRVSWRSMAANTGERTLISALIPPGPAHVKQSVYSAAAEDSAATVLVSGVLASLVADLLVRVAPKSSVPLFTINRLPYVEHSLVQQWLRLRALRLNCVTNAFADLWVECFDTAMQSDFWAGGFEHARRRPLGDVGPEWTRDTPLRIAADRRQALVEIDALVALGLGLTADELCTVYRTQFPVLYGYDRNTYLYDANGRLAPQEVLKLWRTEGDSLSVDERTATNQAGNTYTYEPPFQFLDREADMRAAYAEFEQRLGKTGSS
ncbi:restriction endonuclease subunit M [Mycobacterium mantenii]|uniref:site-specific DNA-methyltransferase (adenine-specific) n=1 Tax=Mycobacterium mantenii TaxID=560555 RepID=A0A1X0G0K9_MYCNT|nr:DNA methyltransferase [Mycobacterium mantenii]MCV7244739.1 class I SAM-dependent DNA methyltransferase [Mycobacterium mantenii]ORB07516.1 restriction endonuclease subunit M [Mycobacterium mantenii]BBY36827.1 restriction endonuclease subunit M [Mycobacterium mantenii]